MWERCCYRELNKSPNIWAAGNTRINAVRLFEMYQNIRKQELGAEAGIGYRVQAAWLGTDTLSGASICLGLLPFLCTLCSLCQTPL